MSHPDEGVLQELLDGELPPADAATVRAHLAGCVPCAVILRDLAGTQSEADAIVARLPLDPPLVRRGARASARRPISLRVIGLAASAVLVAGTSWMLLRSTNRESYLRGSDDSAAGLALPMPTEERQEVPATTPAAPPPPSAAARADAKANADRSESARPAAPQAEKKEKDAEAPREAEANAAAPPAVLAPAAAQFRLTPSQKTSAGLRMSVADAETRLGTRLRTISGLTPVSVEVLPVAADSLPTVRQRYVVSGVPVLLVQQALPAPRDEVTAKARAPVTYFEDARNQAAGRTSGLASVADSAGARPAGRTWEAWGSLFLLEGALPPDSIDALMKRVK